MTKNYQLVAGQPAACGTQLRAQQGIGGATVGAHAASRHQLDDRHRRARVWPCCACASPARIAILKMLVKLT